MPVMVNDLLEEKSMEVAVLQSDGQWFGMTYQEDRERVAEELLQLHENGVYPKSLKEG